MSKLRCDPAPPQSPAGRLHHRSGAQEILKANTATHNAAEVFLKRPIIKNEVQQALAAYLIPGASGDSGRR